MAVDIEIPIDTIEEEDGKPHAHTVLTLIREELSVLLTESKQ